MKDKKSRNANFRKMDESSSHFGKGAASKGAMAGTVRLQADQSQERWVTVFDAIKTYVAADYAPNRSDINQTTNSTSSVQPSVLNKLHEAISKLEKLISPLSSDEDGVINESVLTNVSDNNRELECILQILRTHLPGLIDQVLSHWQRDQVKSGKLDEELAQTKLKWKSQVTKLNEVIAEQSRTITHLTSIQEVHEGREAEFRLDHRMKENEGEVLRLRKILQSTNSNG